MVTRGAEMNEKQGPNSPLLVLGKISAILDAFTLARPVLTMGEIREVTAIPSSTVQRLVTNLVAQGFLDRDGDSFRIGMKMAYWAAPATRGVDMLDLFMPSLRTLRDVTGETVCFYQAEQGHRVCVAMAETRHALRREMHVGKILPLHAGSASQVLLAWDPELESQVLVSALEPFTEQTITDPDVLRAAVRETKEQGFSVTTGQREDAAAGLSAPVFDATGSVVGALSIIGPTMRLPQSVCEGWVEELLTCAERMTRLFGGRFPAEART